MTNNLRTVCISQGAGDVLASIPYIKALGGQFVYHIINMPNVPDWHPVNHGGAQMLLPFLRSQGLDGTVINYSDKHIYEPYDIDMDARLNREWHGSLGDFYTWNSLFYGVWPDMTKEFFENIKPVPMSFTGGSLMSHITSPPYGHSQETIVSSSSSYICFARTARYNQPGIDYTVINSISNIKKIFIGTPAEFVYLYNCFPGLSRDIEFLQIKDYYHAAQVIKGSKLFISNQTSFAVLAEGMAHPRILEVCAQFPSVIPKTPNGRPVMLQQHFEKAIFELLNK